MDEEGFKKTCIKERKKRGGIHQPFYGTWVADFMLRQDAGRFMLGCQSQTVILACVTALVSRASCRR